MSPVDKSLIAAVLAVRQGALPPEKAAELLASEPQALSRLQSAADVDEFDGGTIAISPSLLDVVAERLDGDGDLEGLGLDETTVRTLSQIRNVKADDPSVKDTLLSISPTRLVKDMDIEEDEQSLPVIDAAEMSETSRPTVRPKQVTTKKPSSQILRAIARTERYSIQKEHARGGMGRILIAHDNVVGRDVALKELLPQQPSGGSIPQHTEASRGLTERFLREAKVTGQLEHPNIVSVYEIGKNDDDSLYYTMKFVRGQTLAARLSEIAKDVSLDKKEKLAARLKLLDNFTDVCNAIAYAHSKGVVHRDLKPENVMLGEYGETIVLDWGLARVRGQEDTVAQKLIDSTRYMSQSVVENATDKLTLDGSIVGTPAYMSPEQARGDLDEIDEQSDVYALGAVLYQILSGRAPFEGPVAGLIIQQVLHSKPLRLSAVSPDCPPELEALVEHGMAKDKSERLKSALEFASEVKAYRDGRTLQSYSYSARELAWRWVARHKRSVITGVVVFYLLVAGAVYHYAQLRQEKAAVEEQKSEAEQATMNAKLAFRDARAAEAEARVARKKAEVERAAAKDETAEKERALQGWDLTLADAYAMRIRLAREQHDHNGALSFAAAALQAAEHPEARGTPLSTPELHPLLWNLQPDKASKQEFYQFFDVNFSADGRFVATGMSDGRIWVWSLETGEVHQVLNLTTNVTHDVEFSPSGRWLAASSDSGVVRLWEFNQLSGKFDFNGLEFTNGTKPTRVTSLVFSPDERTLICGGTRVVLYDLLARKLIGEIAGPDRHDPMYLSLSPDGRTLFSTSLRLDDPLVRVWNLPERKFERVLLDQTSLNEVFSAWAPDGSVVATSTLQGQIILRSGDKLRIQGILTAHTGAVFGLNFSPDGKSLISCSIDGTVRLWDVATMTEKQVFTGFSDWIESVAFAPDGRAICARTKSGRVLVWATPQADDQVLRGHTGDVLDVRFSPDGTRFVTASWDGSVILWDAATRKQIRKFSALLVQFFCADFLDDNRIVGAGSNGVWIWDAETGQKLGQARAGEYVMDVDVTPGGKTFRVAQYRGSYQHDSNTFEELSSSTRHVQLALAVRHSPDGSIVATGSQDGVIFLCDPKTDKAHTALAPDAGSLYGIAFSPDGKLLAGAYEDRIARIWSVDDKKVVHELKGHDGVVFSVIFSPDGRFVFTGSQDRTVRVWSTETWACLAVLRGHREIVTRLAVSPDGRTLLSGSQDDTVRIWQLDELSMPRSEFAALAYARTGLVVPDKEFTAPKLDEAWPKGVENHRALLAARLQRDNQQRRFIDEFESRYEGYRYSLRNGARHYYEPRKRGANGRLVGRIEGVVNYAAWWADNNPALVLGVETAPIVSEVLEDGQGVELGLRVGDFLWSIDGDRVVSRDDLRDKLTALKDRDSFAVVIHRHARDADGVPMPKRNAAGDVLLNANGESEWDLEVFEVSMTPAKLGLRVDETSIAPRPYR
ncbi:MAG: protein kinase [Planctomycetota bacterium]